MEGGRKLYEREDGFYVDDRGIVFDLCRDGSLYEQKRPGLWWRVRGPRVTMDRHQKSILAQVEGF
jgi:hypothetical protein